jgi:DNA repair protein RecO (recombination protein O)
VKQVITTGIVLARTNYQEADRIITVLTPDQGKIRLLAKGVRKSKSKMAGGIELFSVAEISFIWGKGDISTLTSSRLKHHYVHIAKDITRTMLGYDLIKLLNKTIEDEPEPEYFELLQAALEALNDNSITQDVIKLWFYAQLLRLAGHSPNLQSDTTDHALDQSQTYIFSYDDMAFTAHHSGSFTADYIKLLRLVFGGNPPHILQQVGGIQNLVPACLQLVQTILPNHLRV